MKLTYNINYFKNRRDITCTVCEHYMKGLILAMKTKPSIKYSSLILTLALICFLIGPWTIGKYIKSSMHDRLALIKTQYPNLDIKLVEFKTDTYHSEALIEGSFKAINYNSSNQSSQSSQSQDKPLFKFSSKIEITHGPIIWDSHGIHFALAEIKTQTSLDNTDYFQCDQTSFDTKSAISFRGIETFILPIERFSGKLNLPMSTVEFDIRNILTNFSCPLNSLYPSYEFTAQVIAIKNPKYGYNVNLNGLRIAAKQLNASSNLKIPDGEQQLSLDKCEIQTANESFQIANIKILGNLISNASTRNLTNDLSFTEANINGVKIGDSNYNFSINNIPEIVFTTLAGLGNDPNALEKYQKSFNTVIDTQEWKLDCIIHQLKIGLPGGDFSLNGIANLHSIPKNNRVDLEQYSKGRLMARLPKQTIIDSLKAFSVPLKAKPEDVDTEIQEITSAIQNSGFAIDTGDQFEIRLVYDKDFYFNGFTLKDTMAKHALGITSIKSPLTADQELMMAIWFADSAKVKDLLKRSHDKLNPDHVFDDVKGPLQTAALMGQVEILRHLLQHHYPIDQSDFRGQTALFCAARAGHLDVASELIKKGASPNRKSSDGWTPLQEASENGFKKMVELLLKHQAEVNAIDNENRTALYWATKNNHKEIVELLLSKGADRNIASSYGKKPIDVARQQGHTELVEILNK